MNRKAALFLLFMLLAAAAVAVLSHTPGLSAQLEAIEAAVIVIRQLKQLEDSALNVQTSEEYEAQLAERFEEAEDDNDSDRFLFYRALDLVEPDLDLEAAYFDFLTAEIVGYYDPETNEMTVILAAAPGDELPLWGSLTYAHEFVHALQDQHYDLEAISNQIWEAQNYDLQLAMDALIEGDASKVTFEYFQKLIWNGDPRVVAEMSGQAEAEMSSQQAAENVPDIIKETFMFPYEEGQAFVNYVVAQLGWSGIDRAFRENPPQTTEHIYHPRRYLDGDVPIDVSLPDPSAVIGGGWRPVYDNVVGEFYLRQHLGYVAYAANGWGGDRMQLFTDDASGDLLWIWQHAWDSARDADFFNHSYRRFLNRRYAMPDGDGPCWTAAATHCFRRINDTETRITYAINPNLALTLLMLDN